MPSSTNPQSIRSYNCFHVFITTRVWMRDGSHAYPGRLLHEDKSYHLRRLLVHDVAAYGVTMACALEHRRQIDRRLETHNIIWRFAKEYLNATR